MGSSESTRRIVVEDAKGEAVVKISDAVVRRMKGLPGGDAPQAKQEPQEPLQPPHQTAQTASVQDEQTRRALREEIERLYMEKLSDLQDRNAALQKTTNDEFAKAVKEVEQKFMTYNASPVCQDLQMKVMECYQTNPNEILTCSTLVKAFTTCVERARVASSLNRSGVSQHQQIEVKTQS